MSGGGERVSINGAARLPATEFATVGGATWQYDDPLTRVLALDESSTGTLRWLGYLLGALALMVGLMAAVRVVGFLLEMTNQAAPVADSTQEIDVVHDEPPPPPEPTAEPKPDPAPAPPPPRAAPHEPPPPAPAQAGKVLAREPDPNEPVDLTGNTFVSGDSDEYRGGVTSSKGTNPTAVHALASPTGTPGGHGPPSAPPGPARDLSRKASASNVDWTRAGFPPEADTAQIDESYVGLQIDVAADGTPTNVRVVKDAGYGFGRQARTFALRQRFVPALDPTGNPVATSITINVHFTR